MTDPVNIGTSFAAGVFSFLSPCVLPLVPGYVSYISGLSLEELSKGGGGREAAKKAGIGSIFFVLGFSVLFTLLGASASWAGQMLAEHMSLLTKSAGVVIVLFGLHTMGAVKIPFLYYEKRFQASRLPPTFGGAFVMGLAFAFGWTPCVGPILAGILALAATEESVCRGMFLLFAYSMGLGIPFILTGFGTYWFMQFFFRYKKFIRWGEIAAGALLVAVGVMIFSNRLTLLASWMPSFLNKFAQ